MIDFETNYADQFAEEVEKAPFLYHDSIKLAVRRYREWKKTQRYFLGQ